MTCHVSRILVMLALLAAPGLAQPSKPTKPDPFACSCASLEPASTGIGFYAENDVFGFTTDQNYTGGFGLSLGGRWVAEAGITGPLSLFDRISHMKGAHDAREVHRHGLTILGSAYTPRRDDLSITTPILDDRPYASLFGFQTRRVSVRRADDAMKRETRSVTSELTIAALGWNLAKALQTDLHRSNRRRSGKSTPVDPLGWPNQISNGGEPTLLYTVGVEQLFHGAGQFTPGWQSQATWNVQGSLGYYDNASVGLTGRLGRLASNFWEFNSNPMSSVAQKSNAPDDRNPWELYGYGAVHAKTVLYNVLLQGQFRQSAHTFSFDQVNHFLGEGEVGVVGGRTVFGGMLSLTLMAAGRTPEFNGPKSRTHAWGAVHLSFAQRLPMSQ